MIENKLHQLRNDDKGVSPVIAVILMVAVTVVLAAIVGSMVMGMGDSMSQPVPNAQFAANDAGAVFHDGGATLDADNTGKLSASQNVDWSVGSNAGSTAASTTIDTAEIQAGDEIISAAPSGPTEIVWHSPNGENSETIFTIP